MSRTFTSAVSLVLAQTPSVTPANKPVTFKIFFIQFAMFETSMRYSFKKHIVYMLL